MRVLIIVAALVAAVFGSVSRQQMQKLQNAVVRRGADGDCPMPSSVRGLIKDARSAAFPAGITADNAVEQDPCPGVVTDALICYADYMEEEFQNAADELEVDVDELKSDLLELTIGQVCYRCNMHRMFECCATDYGCYESPAPPSFENGTVITVDEMTELLDNGLPDDFGTYGDELAEAAIEEMEAAYGAYGARPAYGEDTSCSFEMTESEEAEMIDAMCAAAPCAEEMFNNDWRCWVRPQFLEVAGKFGGHVQAICGFDESVEINAADGYGAQYGSDFAEAYGSA